MRSLIAKLIDFKNEIIFLRYPREFRELIDSDYYFRTYPTVKKAGISAFHHYILHGANEDRRPNALFDTKFYRDKWMDKDDMSNPLLHYILNKDKFFDPHPLFESKYYFNLVKDALEENSTLLNFFLKNLKENKYYPNSYFDPGFYLHHNKDVLESGLNPLLHFAEFGEDEGRWPSEKINPNLTKLSESLSEHTDNKRKYGKRGGTDPLVFLNSLKRLDSDKPTIICMTHEATRTGAPLIILKIGEQLKSYFDVNIIFIVGYGGEIIEDFSKLGPMYLFNDWNPGFPNKTSQETSALVSMIKDVNPIGSIINSAESRHVVSVLKHKGIPVISLIHEMGYVYPAGTFKPMADSSDLVIFPSHMVKDLANENYYFDSNKVLVRGQGLLKPELLKVDVDEARVELRELLDIPEDSFIVLGCGSLTRRKAPEFFVSTAIHVLDEGLDNIYFIWVGGHHPMIPEKFNWEERDIKIKGYQDKIRFLGAKSNSTVYFAGSDLFFMTSRADPFPCVIHEAMAVRIPILGFEEAGGFSEALEDNCGILVPYANINAAAKKIIELNQNTELAKTIGDNARRKVEDKYDYLDYTLEIAENLINISSSKEENLNELSEMFERQTSVIAMLRSRGESPVSRKKIFFLLASWEVSGVNSYVENLIKGLIKLGYDASILFTSIHHKYLDSKYLPDVPFSFLERTSSDFWDIWQDLKDYFPKNDISIVFPNHDYVASAVSPALHDKVGIVGVLHSDDVEHYEHGYRLGRYWNRIVSVSKTIEDKLLEINPGFKEKSSVIYYGIDVPQKMIDKRINKKLKIVYTGRIVEYQKRISDFVPIIKEMDRRGMDFEVCFIGEGEKLGFLKNELKDFIKEKKVKITGRIPMEDVFKYLKQSHVFALTSEFEGLPLSLLEAMAYNCVPVLTDIESGISEVIEHGENGLISPVGDPIKFVDNLELLYQDKELITKLGKSAFNTLKEFKLRTQDMADSYAKLIENVIDEIESEKYQRPKVLTFNSKSEDILMPPMLQLVPKGYDEHGNII